MTSHPSSAIEGPVELLSDSGKGPLWGMASKDLNATLLLWPAGHVVAEHVNAEIDVLVVVLDGSAAATIDGAAHDVPAGSAILIPSGTRRRIMAGNDGVRYLTVHRRRGPLQIHPAPER